MGQARIKNAKVLCRPAVLIAIGNDRLLVGKFAGAVHPHILDLPGVFTGMQIAPGGLITLLIGLIPQKKAKAMTSTRRHSTCSRRADSTSRGILKHET